MNNSKNFDLMQNKPALDRDTLNYVWDALWRFNHSVRPTNNEKRIRVNEREHIMGYIQALADRIEEV